MIKNIYTWFDYRYNTCLNEVDIINICKVYNENDLNKLIADIDNQLKRFKHMKNKYKHIHQEIIKFKNTLNIDVRNRLNWTQFDI
tara:strand:+ start:268 stop:522 length:255 start_codon:yes stop_codon:yes gene_type:complete